MIEEFIDAKSIEERKAWALIEQGYNPSYNGDAYGSVMYQNENLSVRVGDAFMEKAERWLNDGMPATAVIPAAGPDYHYRTRRVRDGEICELKHAGALMKKIAEGVHVCGDPGMQFDDVIHTWHTCKGTDRQQGFTAETLVDTSEGFLTIEQLASATERGESLPLAFCYDIPNHEPCLRQITGVTVSGLAADVAVVRTQKGVVLHCGGHQDFNRYKHGRVKAQDLASGVRLTKICRRVNHHRGGRRCIYHKGTPRCPNGTEWMNRWMWKAAYGPIPEGMEVHHRDGNCLNDKLSNFQLIESDVHDLLHSTGSQNPRFIHVPQELLAELWEDIQRDLKESEKSDRVTVSRWNRYIRKHHLVGKIPLARYDRDDGGRIQGLSWSEFEEQIRLTQKKLNDRVASVELLTLPEPVPLLTVHVEGTENFGVTSPGALEPHSLIAHTANRHV